MSKTDIQTTEQPPPSCPICAYNLTGLPTSRCPECGRAFDRDEVLAAAARPTIAFERARGGRRVLGFVKTWLCVMFTPWVFARQISRRYSLRHALVFAAICFAGALPHVLVDYYYARSTVLVLAWLVTAAAYLVAQAWLVAFMDPRTESVGCRFRFWLVVGCYTSAVMLTESATGPPYVQLTWPPDVLQGRFYLESGVEFVPVMQLTLWLASVGCCYFVRRRVLRSSSTRAMTQTIGSCVVLFILCFAAYEFMGFNLYLLIESP